LNKRDILNWQEDRWSLGVMERREKEERLKKKIRFTEITICNLKSAEDEGND